MHGTGRAAIVPLEDNDACGNGLNTGRAKVINDLQESTVRVLTKTDSGLPQGEQQLGPLIQGKMLFGTPSAA
jgi:hypothetical protein